MTRSPHRLIPLLLISTLLLSSRDASAHVELGVGGHMNFLRVDRRSGLMGIGSAVHAGWFEHISPNIKAGAELRAQRMGSLLHKTSTPYVFTATPEFPTRRLILRTVKSGGHIGFGSHDMVYCDMYAHVGYGVAHTREVDTDYVEVTEENRTVLHRGVAADVGLALNFAPAGAKRLILGFYVERNVLYEGTQIREGSQMAWTGMGFRVSFLIGSRTH